MASRFLDRLKRSLFKDGPAGQEDGSQQEEAGFKDCWEAELEEEEESVSERLGGTLRFDTGAVGYEDGAEGDSDSDFLGDPMEEGLGSAGDPSSAPVWTRFCVQL